MEGDISAGWFKKGIAFLMGVVLHAAKEAAPTLKPKIFKKSRRFVEETDAFSAMISSTGIS
jgi:hypothetical protein